MTPDPKPKTTRLKGKKLRALRQACYDRAGGCCEECGAPTPWSGGVFTRGHMAHIKSRGSGGSDTIENIRWLCPQCHVGDGGEHGLRWSKGEK